MASIYNKIHRLKQQPGWDWARFQAEIDSVDPDGISLKLLQNYYRSPHKTPTRHVVQIIEFLHHECFPSPFPDEYDRLMHVYRELKTSRRHLTKAKDMLDLDHYVNAKLAKLADKEYLSRACLEWLLGNIQFDYIEVYAEQREHEKVAHSMQAALEHYQTVLNVLTQHNLEHQENKVSELHLYRVHYNMVACYLNTIPEDAYMSHDAASLKYVRESNYFAHCKTAIAEEPFQWSIARNGLRFSSLLKDEEEVKCFFDLLIKVHPRFVDLSYEPYNQLSISVMEDYKWAIKHVLTPEYLRQIKKKLKAKGEQSTRAA